MKQSQLLSELHFSGFALFVRLLIASIAGIVIAGALTLFMKVLIEFSQQELVDSVQVNFLDFVRVKRDETSQRKQPKPERPKQQEAPPAPPTPQSNEQSMGDNSLQVAMPTASADINVQLGVIGTGDGEYLPIVKVAPAYPIEASVNNIEGSCLVEFTVTTTGATRDIETVPGACPKVFARPSIMAATKFKYKPRIVDGEPIEVPNVQNLFNYTLSNPGQQQ